jgi:hypothetical protein
MITSGNKDGYEENGIAASAIREVLLTSRLV